MPDYLADASRRSAPGRTTVGLATDGATLLAYTLDRGTLAQIGRYDVEVEHPERLLSWLEPLLSPVPEVMPTPIAVNRWVLSGLSAGVQGEWRALRPEMCMICSKCVRVARPWSNMPGTMARNSQFLDSPRSCGCAWLLAGQPAPRGAKAP